MSPDAVQSRRVGDGFGPSGLHGDACRPSLPEHGHHGLWEEQPMVFGPAAARVHCILPWHHPAPSYPLAGLSLKKLSEPRPSLTASATRQQDMTCGPGKTCGRLTAPAPCNSRLQCSYQRLRSRSLPVAPDSRLAAKCLSFKSDRVEFARLSHFGRGRHSACHMLKA